MTLRMMYLRKYFVSINTKQIKMGLGTEAVMVLVIDRGSKMEMITVVWNSIRRIREEEVFVGIVQ